MMILYYFASAFDSIKLRLDDDFIDKMNYFYTTSILASFAILVSAKQYVGYPIQCWVPATFTAPMEQYTENYCWVENTYFVVMDDEVPDIPTRYDKRISYYQWTPFILAIEALMFYLPCIIWRGLIYWHSGVNLHGLIRTAQDARLYDDDVMDRSIRVVARRLHDEIILQMKPFTQQTTCCRGRGRRYYCRVGTRCGCYLTFVYLLIKFLYAINVVAQFFLLNHFFGTQNLLFGFDILVKLLREERWDTTGIFPRVTLCDFKVRVLGNVHNHTVQCVLMINMFTEKIMLFLWFWYLIMGVMTVLNMIHWMYLSLFPGQRATFLQKYMTCHENTSIDPPLDNKTLDQFAGYLKADGVFMLRTISLHAGETITNRLVTTLWCDFKMSKSNV